MTLTPAPESSKKLSGSAEDWTWTRTQISPSRNSNGNAAKGFDSARDRQHTPQRIIEAIRRRTTDSPLAIRVPRVEQKIGHCGPTAFAKRFRDDHATAVNFWPAGANPA